MDYIYNDDDNQLGRLSLIVKSFSPQRNLSDFFADKQQPKSDDFVDLSYFDFLKSYIIERFTLVSVKHMTTLTLGADFASQIMMNAAVFIELVFFMSGTLAAISGLKYFESRHKVPFSLYIISRAVRVVPVLLITIAFNILFVYLGSGPTFKYYYDDQIANCDRALWQNLLFIHNWYPVPEQCAYSTWFISAEMQLFLLSYFGLTLLAKRCKYGVIYSAFFIALGMIVPGILTAYYNIPPPIIRTINEGILDEEQKAHIYHCSTYSHLTEYFMGLLTGPAKIFTIFQYLGNKRLSKLCFAATMCQAEYILIGVPSKIKA
ncbi:unnamed protein product, partial [Medioppia subpectinata]